MHSSAGPSSHPRAARTLARVLACAAVVAGGVATTPARAQTVFSDRAALLAALVSTPETQPETHAAMVPGDVEGGKMSYLFYGVISPTPFTQFTLEVLPNPLAPPAILDARDNDVTIAAIPEPGTLALLGGGLLALGMAAMRRGRAARRDDGA